MFTIVCHYTLIPHEEIANLILSMASLACTNFICLQVNETLYPDCMLSKIRTVGQYVDERYVIDKPEIPSQPQQQRKRDDSTIML